MQEKVSFRHGGVAGAEWRKYWVYIHSGVIVYVPWVPATYETKTAARKSTYIYKGITRIDVQILYAATKRYLAHRPGDFCQEAECPGGALRPLRAAAHFSSRTPHVRCNTPFAAPMN